MLAVLVAVWCALVAWDVYRQRWRGPVLAGAWVAALLVLRRRPPTVVDGSGVRMPWRRRGHIPWIEVDSVAPSRPGVPCVRLNLVDGSTVSLGGIANPRSAEVAALGGKRVAATASRRRPASAQFRPSPSRRRTCEDIEADISRRALALAEERAAWERREARFRGPQRPGADAERTAL